MIWVTGICCLAIGFALKGIVDASVEFRKLDRDIRNREAAEALRTIIREELAKRGGE